MLLISTVSLRLSAHSKSYDICLQIERVTLDCNNTKYKCTKFQNL